MDVKKMNKISLVGDTISINNEDYEIITNDHGTINLDGTSKLLNYDTNNHNLTFNIKDNSNINLHFIKILTNDVTLNIKIAHNIFFNLELLILNKGQNKLRINLETIGNNNNINLKIRILNKTNNSNMNLICDGFINSKTKDNVLVEDIKGLIINNDTIKISPNIMIDTNEVLANHLVTISSFNPDDLFYLNTKGIATILAKKMLIKGFINSIIDEYFKDLLNMEVINIE